MFWALSVYQFIYELSAILLTFFMVSVGKYPVIKQKISDTV